MPNQQDLIMNISKIVVNRSLFVISLVICFSLPNVTQAAPLSWNSDVIGWTDDSNQDWLRLDLADLQSITYADYTSGINYAGRSWRLASVDEIVTLWNEFAPYVHDSGTDITGRYQTTAVNALALRAAFGTTYATRIGGKSWVRGYSADAAYDINGDLRFVYSPYLYLDFSGSVGGTNYYSEEFWNSGGYGAPANNYDAWLVAAVPLPAASWLFGSALLGIVGIARKRKHAVKR